MVFNSLEFAVFFLIVFSLYWVLRPRPQVLLLVVASYVFYGWWDWRFLTLILASTLVDFFCARAIPRAGPAGRRRLLLVSLCFNLGLLGLFKYYNFFAASLTAALESIGLGGLDLQFVNIVLPVGISFYTFQTMGYTIDVYRGEVEPTDDFLGFALYVSFFPQLVAGPIERVSSLLPQLVSDERRLTFSRLNQGGYLILWGMFKKVVIADNLALVVERAFSQPGSLNALTALVGVYAFAWQIYCDFSGYTDIARGVAKLLGIELRLNFFLPYFATSPSDFWQRWHISLSSWLRDYLYIPLGGNRIKGWMTYRNLMLTMLLGGLWHGASWMFVIWGAYHGLLLCAYRPFQKRLGALLERSLGWRVFHTLAFFHLTCIGWLFFRADSVGGLTEYLAAFARAPSPEGLRIGALVLVGPLVAIQCLQFAFNDRNIIFRLPFVVRVAFYIALYAALITIGRWESSPFIYFQF